uniref:Cadherin domain-containing protein n=1 Tax=Globodera rostochiensis TaxID=31243 RepID=A0A914I537_GLORO
MAHLFLITCLAAILTPQGILGRHKHFHHRVPIIDLDGAEQLVGTVREDDRTVNVSPQLRILHGTGPICHYELSWADDDASGGVLMPFEVRVLDTAEGTAQIRHKNGAEALDCAVKSEFRIRLSAMKCGDDAEKSEAVELKITVQDVNNHAPEFDAPWYSFDVDEGQAHAEIARLYARDKDCGHPYGEVCRYELTNTLADSPFRIDSRGVLSVQRPLNRSTTESHILTVVAEDCGMLRSKSALVTVHVRPRCVDALRLHVAAQRARHVTQGEPRGLIVFPEAEVIACGASGVECRAEADVELEQSGKEHLVLAEALAECGLRSADAVQLLPEGNGKAQAMKQQQNEKKKMNKDEEEAADDEGEEEEDEDEKWAFDGKTNLVVSKERMDKVVPERFTLLFSMNAEAGTEEQQRQKQNIICETDAKGLNRHHFAVYLRRCKLELLLRRETEHANAEFRAAEWRWSDARICDGEWHRYGLIFNDLDNVQLLIDGEPFNATDRNPEVLDDWPLHEVKARQTKLTIGACWHGRQRDFVQFFTGHLSSVWLWPGRAQAPEAIGCAHGQHYRLTIDQQLLKLQHGQSVRFTATDRTQLHLHAASPVELALLIRAIRLAVDPLVSGTADQHRVAPSVREGTRRVTLSAQLVCANTSRPLAPIQAMIDVSRVHDRTRLSITGRHIVNADSATLKSGAALLPDVQIAITQGGADVTGGFKLDWCRVHMRPARDMDLELFSSPTALLQQLNVQFVHDAQGFALTGEESAQAYMQLLTHIHYFNLRPASFPHRSYTLQCAMLGGKVLSNELFTTMQIEISDKLDQDIPFGSVVSSPPSSPSSSSERNDDDDDNNIVDDAKQSQEHLLKDDPLLSANFDQLSASNRLQNILEMDLPRPKALHANGYEMGQGAIAGGAVAVVVVICVGFLLVLLVVGVLKMRDQPLPMVGRRRGSRRDSMLEWDDNGLMNITVNPLEEVEGKEREEYSDDEEEEEDGEDSASDDGGDKDAEVSEDEEDNDATKRVLPLVENGRQGAGLEWDDSTLDGTTAAKHRTNQDDAKPSKFSGPGSCHCLILL